MNSTGLFSIFLSFTLLTGSVHAQTTFEIFEIHYSDAGDLKNAVQAILSEEGKVSVNSASNSLIVKDRPKVLEQVRTLIARLDKKPKNIRISVEFIEESRLKELGVDVRWRVGGPGWTVGVMPFPMREGLAVDAKAARSGFKGRKKQSLLIMENRPGRIFVGEEVPFSDYYIQYGYKRGYITQNVRFKKAGTSFAVTARTIEGGKIRVILEPEVSYYDRERKSFTVKNAATTIIIDDPGTVAVASSDDKTNSFSVNFLRGLDRENSQSNFVMILSARSED